MEVYVALKKHEIQKPFFTKTVAKAKKEAPAPAKAKAKEKALKAKKAVFKGIHSHKKRRPGHRTRSDSPKHCDSRGSRISLEEHPEQKQV